ncbi:hypothetical protein HZH68_009475 [Vespula germanica]|uniref:Uncharacterized protein n=1 Tax=Vespula germanica TaxID=30212 RepID=A0A834JWJ1_VESGE|nr:hypothetical protein HZH68_009475 [Vespula germanica]
MAAGVCLLYREIQIQSGVTWRGSLKKAGLLGYCDTVGNTENFPPAPNIVVEGGRIEFVRPSQDGTTISRRNTMSRGSQTFNDQSEKSDPAKEDFLTVAAVSVSGLRARKAASGLRGQENCI